MKNLFVHVSYPLIVIFFLVCILSTVTPQTLQAHTRSRGIYGLVGAIAGAVTLGVLAASFGPVGMVCAGLIGAGVGFFSGATIGGLLGGGIGGLWGALSGIGVGGMLGGTAGVLVGASLAAQFGWIGIVAGALVGAWGGRRLLGAVAPRPTPPPHWGHPYPYPNQYPYAPGAPGETVAGAAEPVSAATDHHAFGQITQLYEVYREAQRSLERAIGEGCHEKIKQARDCFHLAEEQFFEARGTILGY